MVVWLSWLSGRALATQARGVLGSTPGGCGPFFTFLYFRLITSKFISKFACRVCLKRWDLSYPAMLRTLSIPTLAARRQLKLCTFFRYVNQLSIAPIANITHRVPPFQSRHIHDLAYVCPIARTNQYMKKKKKNLAVYGELGRVPLEIKRRSAIIIILVTNCI